MAKRFTDSSKWADEWFSELSPQHKLAWLYMLDHCDSVGVWKPNFKLANFQLGFSIDWDEFKTICGNKRILVMENTCWWIIKFCDYQYGALKEDSKSQTTKFYINLLKKHGLYNNSEQVKEKALSIPRTQQDKPTFKLHFDSVIAFFSEPYELKVIGYKEQFTKAEYDRFGITIKKIVETFPQVQIKFERCMSIGDWKKHLSCKGFAILKPAIEKMLAYENAPGAEMVFRIKQFLDKEDSTVLKTK